MKKNFTHYFIICTFVSLYLIVSAISTVHVINFFELSNPKWLAISLALAFEVGAAASLASLVILEKMNKFIVWSLFIILTAMQAMGNTYYAYVHLEDFRYWSELFGIIDEDIIFQKRLLSIISGATLPIISLGFIKSLVDYIKPQETEKSIESNQEGNIPFEGESTDFIEKSDHGNASKMVKGDIEKFSISQIDESSEIPNNSGWAPESIEPINSGSLRSSNVQDPVLNYISRISK